MPKIHRAIQAVFFGFDGTLTKLTRSRAELAEEGAQRMTRWLTERGIALPPDFVTQWLAARRFAEQKSRQEGEEHTADNTLAFLLKLHGHGSPPAEVIEGAVDAFFSAEASHRVLFEDALPALHSLRNEGYFVGIIANSSCDRAIRREIDRLGLRRYIDLVVTSAAVEARMPRQEIYQRALDQIDVLGHEAVMVSAEAVPDLEGAREAQMWTIHISREEAITAASHTAPDSTARALIEAVSVIKEWAMTWGWRYAEGEDDVPFAT